MTLKDIIRDDIEDVFFDLDEFAEMHSVNGKQMAILIDANELTERVKKERVGQHFDGAYRAGTLIYVKAEEYGSRPKVGSVVTLDGKNYRVTDAAEEGGVYSITLEANRI